jgi:hypothetical protein
MRAGAFVHIGRVDEEFEEAPVIRITLRLQNDITLRE